MAKLKFKPSEASVQALVKYLNEEVKPFSFSFFGTLQCKFLCTSSTTGLIRVCHDIYGAEVYVGSYFSDLLDCCYTSYGLTKEQADRLYNAILEKS